MFLNALLVLATASNMFEAGQQFAEQEERKYKLKQALSEIVSSSAALSSSTTKPLEKTGKCYVNELSNEDGPSFYVFITLGMPDETLIALSQNLAKAQGIFVLQGLPENSFKQFASRIYALRQQGMLAPIQINPPLFNKYKVSSVPCFVVTEEDTFDKIAGNISLEYALEKLAKDGETTKAKELWLRF